VSDPVSVRPRGDEHGELLLARVRVAVAERYDGLREIGRGGMAVVYAARDRRLNRDVAIKVLPPELAYRVDVRERFVREAQTAARLNHPCIVPIYEVDEADGLVFFVMALVSGESLATRLARETRPPLAFVRDVLAQVADALAYAHRLGVVHRDIKPDNILLEHLTGRAVVTDFGIARAAEAGARLTQTGIAVGTPAFMSPEQAMGQREVDGRSDVYALGLVGYLMLAGRLPFDAETSAGMLLQHVHGTPFPLANYRADLPFGMIDGIMRAIARDPAQRWPDAAAFAAAMRAVGEEAAVGVASPPRAVVRVAPALPVAAHEPRTNAPVVDALERMNASLAAASDQLRRGREAAAGQVERVAPRALEPRRPEGGAHTDGSPEREARARHVVEVFQRRLKTTGMAFGVAVASVVAIAITDSGVFAAPMIGGAVVGTVSALRTLRQWFRLRDVGVSARDAIGERWRDRIAAQPRTAAATTSSRAPTGALAHLSGPERVAAARALVLSWKRRLTWTLGPAAVSLASLIVGVSANEQVMIAPMLAAGALASVNAILLARRTWQLRRMGIGVRDAYGDAWESAVQALDTRSRAERLRDEVAAVADRDVLATPAGRVLREALEDRFTIRETWDALNPMDRQLVPDVIATADALLDRITALATSLARLDGAVAPDAVQALDERIAAAETAERAGVAEAERRLSLLRRQRASMAELTEREATMQDRLERASLALRSLRFDVVKLRALGVGATVNDVSMATQEARAVSVDIDRALDVANDLRRL
jgi:hypothetical protein